MRATLFFLTAALSAQPFDILITNGRIADGTGGPWYRADVAIVADRIAAIGKLAGARAARTIDAGGLVVAPGFIDIHSHGRRGIFEVPSAENYIRQGVTTIVEGPDGGSPLPLAPFLEKVRAARPTLNFATFVGQGTVRQQVIGLADRKATAQEIATMQELVRQAMREGAFGMSTGLFYVPGNYTPTEEVIALAKAAGELGGIHISHMRAESAQIADSVAETIRIGEEGGLPTQVTHHKITGRPNWGKSKETIAMVEAARARGVDVTLDQYPYTASSTGTAALFPQWSLEGGHAELLKRLRDPAARERIKAEIVRRILDDRGGGDPKNVVMASCAHDASLAGKSLSQITDSRGQTPTPQNAADIAIEIQQKGGCSAVYHAINEEDVERILRYPFTMVASDGGIPVFGQDVPHPRNYGAFARVLGHYVRERRVITLEDAVRRMSSLPANRLKLEDRGLLRPGMRADIAVFDPAVVADKATFTAPHQYAAGFRHVLVNGTPVLLDGAMTAERPGRVLYGPARLQPDALAGVADIPGLPRVLLIGDSISIGYTPYVRELLAGRANVHRIPTNGGPTTNGTAHIGEWLAPGKWDVIHFNWGLHDLKIMDGGKHQVEPAEYEANLRALVAKMKATGAKLIWASTTPVPEGRLNPPRRPADVPVYNEIAARVMRENGIPTNDLFLTAGARLREIQLPENVHFRPEGYRELAEAVARSIAGVSSR